jgi:mannose-1-phosphate guanylyltransferase
LLRPYPVHDPATLPDAPETWGLVLAGGDGTRLRDLTQLLTGKPIPKQYCRITGTRSMLETTLDRVRPVVRPEQTLVVVNRDHLGLALPQIASLPGENALVQPCNRDTGPGILWSLLEVERRRPGAMVAMFPSDHYVADARAFQDSVRQALRVVERHPEKLALLGIEPDDTSDEYGYVVPAAPLEASGGAVFHVGSFREKPERPLAARIVAQGGLWNSFVMAFRARRALELVATHLPVAYGALAEASRARATLEEYYAGTTAWNFSSDLLARITAHLLVVRAERTGWSDWGTPRAIERTFAQLNRVPPWQCPATRAVAYRDASHDAA